MRECTWHIDGNLADFFLVDGPMARNHAAAVFPEIGPIAGNTPQELLPGTPALASANDHCISNILSSATRAHDLTLFLTLIGFTTLPSTRFSSAQHRCCGDMRNMVVQRQPESSKVMTCLSGYSLAKRLIRWISVPM